MLDNFRQALREVFSLENGSGSNATNGITPSHRGKETLPVENRAPDQVKTSEAKSGNTPGPDSKKPQGLYNPLKSKHNEPETTYITSSTIIEGTVKTDSNLKIAGKIKGNVEGKDIAVIGGKITGDINCTNLAIEGSQVEGNITAAEVADIGRDNTITGNVSAKYSKVAGKVKGDVNVKQDLEVEEVAVILGNITANLMSIKKGAALQGNVNVRSTAFKTQNEKNEGPAQPGEH